MSNGKLCQSCAVEAARICERFGGVKDGYVCAKEILAAASPAGEGEGGEYLPNYWLIYFHDADRKPEIYTDEVSARKRYKQISASWNADLFVHSAKNYYVPKTSGEQPANAVSVPREIDRNKHAAVLAVWNDCMRRCETLEMTWPNLVDAMLAAAKEGKK